MKSFLRKNKYTLTLLVSLSASSCANLFDVDPQEALTPEQVYRNVFDADAAVLGVYGKFMNLAKQHVVLNELRADLMDVTGNADAELRQLNEHGVVEGNSYADPRPYYEVILNCNDILKNFRIMLDQNKMRADEYNQRSADITSLRTWVYLQAGIQFGAVPYVTDTYEKATELANLTTLPKLPLEALVKELIKTVETIPKTYLEPYTTTTSLVAAPVDGYPLNKFFINKHILLGDLYLWDNQYRKAAETYRLVMETATRTGMTGEAFYATYKIHYGGANNDDIAVGYADGVNDINRLADANNLGWRSMFARRSTEAWFNNEWIWFLPFDKNFNPKNPFVDLFSPIGGRYLVAPSRQAVDLWNSQRQANNFPFDARGRLTYKTVAGSPVIMKYLYNYINPTTGLPIGASLQEKNGTWFLYRAATLHLRFAEAANRDGRRRLAMGLMNNGIGAAFDPDPANRDQTNKQATFDVPPYNFNARNGDVPLFREDWYRNTGIRGRAALQPVTVVTGDSTVSIENSLIEESALEVAYEGHRWPDLIRIALRRNDPAFLADKVYQKLKKANNPNAEAVRTKLMDKNNWFLPFKVK